MARVRTRIGNQRCMRASDRCSLRGYDQSLAGASRFMRITVA